MKKTSSARSFIPVGWRTITPRLFAADPKALCAFLKKVCRATGKYRVSQPTIMTIGDSMLMISGIQIRKPSSAVFYVYVSNTDATYKRALSAGAKSIEPPADTPYGDRRCIVKDAWGNTWQIATSKGDA
jgi:PhnB protein